MERDNINKDKRSTKHILVPYCALAQGIRAKGIVKHYPAVVKDVIEYLIQEEINIMQMPCPELFFDKEQNGGINRQPCGKSRYDTENNRKVCRRCAVDVVNMIRLFQSGGYDIIGILGVNYSPSCAVDLIRFDEKGTGIYIEELQKVLNENSLSIPFIGIENGKIDKTIRRLKEIISQTYFK